MAKQILGKVAYVSNGTYNNTTKYDVNDVVAYLGSSYVSLKETQGNLPTDKNFWQLIAAKGDIGPVGPQGIQGVQGIQGETGPIGPQGPKPVVGFDYFTEEDKTEIVAQITDSANSDFNKNYDEKIKLFDANVKTKQTAYDTNATSKLKTYNDNHTEKLEEYNNNHNTKLAAYNQNADDKMNDFDENVENQINHYNNSVTDFETVLDVVTPKQVAKGNEIVIDDALPLSIFETKIEGKSFQNTTNGYQLFDYNKIPSKSQGGATVTNNLDGSFTISGEGILTGLYSNFVVLTHEESVALLKPGNITMTTNQKTSIYPYFALRNGAGSIYEVNAGTVGSQTRVVTQEMLDDESFYVRIGFYGNKDDEIPNVTLRPMVFQEGDGIWEAFTGGQPGPNTKYPQEIKNIADVTLEIGQDSQIKSYPISLNNNFIGNLGEIADELLVDKKRNVSINKYIFKKIFDGTENWFKSGLSTSSVFVIALDITNLNINFSYRIYFLSNYFRYNAASIQKNTFRIYEGESNKYYIAFCFDINEISTLSDAITWLTNNQLELEFISNNVETIQLEKLSEPIKTFEGVNNIQLLTNLDTEFEVKYALDIKKYIDKQNGLQDTQINEINTLLSSAETSAMLLDNYQKDLESEV